MGEKQTVLEHRRNEGHALVELADMGLDTPEDREVYDQMVADHQAEYTEIKGKVDDLVSSEVKAGNHDRQYRVDSGDHNAR